jgi:hypothetical protein
MRTRTAILIALLAILHLALLFAGFFAPYDPTTQNRELPYAPPTRVHFKDSLGFHLRPISSIVIKEVIKKTAAMNIRFTSL